MKKIIAMILAFILLACMPALAADDPIALRDAGITVDCRDILSGPDYTVELIPRGILSREPQIILQEAYYVKMSAADIEAFSDGFEDLDPEAQQERIGEVTARMTSIASIVVTNAESLEAAMQHLGVPDDEGMHAEAFGAAEGFHFYFITESLGDFPADLAALSDDLEAAQIEAEIESVRAGLLEAMKAAELYAPVDPLKDMIGRELRFETTDLDGNAVSSEDMFRDNRITMVNFWGTWCGNCVDEMAELAKLHTRMGEAGCGIVGIEYEQTPPESYEPKAREIMEACGTNYPNVLMPEDDWLDESLSAFPTTLFVDSEGRILTMPIVGAYVDKYAETFDRLLAGEEVDVEGGTATADDLNEYRVAVCDQDGAPVEGVVVQMCDDTACAFQQTGADGVAVFAMEEQKAYEVHILKVPEGFVPNEEVYTTEAVFSELRIPVERLG